ncbi:MAG: FG-GAP-like repeat-containing protein [Chitinophagales bacterium]
MKAFKAVTVGVGFFVGLLALVAGLGWGCTIANAAYPLSFTNAAPYSVGTNLTATTSGDFNKDGKIDLAIANTGTDQFNGGVSILLNTGDGTFNAACTAGAQPYDIIAKDFNRDNKLDIAMTNKSSDNTNTVIILLGNGEGAFTSAISCNVIGTDPQGLTAGDFNGDFKWDLAVANTNSDNVAILLGNGDGSFNIANYYSVGDAPYHLTTADFNGDSELDLAVTNRYSNNISILFGNGNGAFPTKTDYPIGNYPAGIVAEDFNKDGKMDLAAADTNWADIMILLGNGDGTFPTQRQCPSGFTPIDLISGDFNGDGNIDLAATNSSENVTSILAGRGDGSFESRVQFVVGTEPKGITTADFNGDGKSDLAVTNSGSNNVSILTNATYIPGILNFDGSAFGVNEACGQVTVTVNRKCGRDGTVTVNYYTVDGTATAGSDYTTTKGTLTFSEGESSKTISIPIINDNRGETLETFTLNITKPSTGAVIGSQDSIRIEITDNDIAGSPGSILFQEGIYFANENEGDVLLNVKRIEGDCGRVTVDYCAWEYDAIADQDFTAVSGTLVFQDQQTEAVIRVPLINDVETENDETFTVCLDNPGGGVTLGTPAEAVVIILDDESRPAAEVTGLKLTPGDGEISVTWTDPTSSNLAKIHLYIKPDGGDYGEAIDVDKGVLSYAFTGLVNGRTYQIKVVTVNGVELESAGVVKEEVPIGPNSLPDLVTNSLQVTGGIYPGGKAKISFMVVNQGLAVSGKSDVKVYLQASENEHPENCIGTKALSALKPNKSKKISLSVVLPADLTGDNAYLLVVADGSHLVTESDEWNNWSMATPVIQYPDLAFSVMPTVTGTLESGAEVTIQDIVNNKGGAPAGKCEVTYYVTDLGVPGSDVKIGTRSVAALKIGKTSKGKVKLTVPSIGAGNWILKAVIDEANVVKEKDKTNNGNLI